MSPRAHLALIPSLALSLALGCPAPDEPLPPQPPATAHWMADVFVEQADAPLGQILLPGAFNSSSYACALDHGISPDAPAAVLALWDDDPPEDHDNRPRIVAWSRTQGRSLGQQLLDGIRFLEINVTVRDGVLTTWHSVYGVPLAEVLDEVVAFSVAWPDEVVVLSFGFSVDSEDWPLLADALLAPRADGVSLCDRVYDGDGAAAMTTVGDVRERGRNLIWSPGGELRTWLEERGDCSLSRGGADRIWSITDTPQGVEDALTGSVDTRDPSRLLINDFAFSLDGADSIGSQVDYLLGYFGVQEASEALGFAGDFPTRLIETHDAGGNLNVLAGAWYQDTDLIEAAIARNRARWGAGS